MQSALVYFLSNFKKGGHVRSVKGCQKFYSVLQRNSNLQHCLSYAQFYRREDEISKDDISHSGKCDIVTKLSARFNQPITVLDLGCGTGRYFHCVRNVKYLVGADCSQNMLKMARDPVNNLTTNIHLVQGSLYEIEFKRESFDLIICIGVFGGLCPLDKFALARIAEFLKPKGVLFFTVPEYLPSSYTWKGKIAKTIEPFLFGLAKRYIHLRLRRFTMTEQKVKKLLTLDFKHIDISRWQSPTRRVDLHCIATKGNRKSCQLQDC